MSYGSTSIPEKGPDYDYKLDSASSGQETAETERTELQQDRIGIRTADNVQVGDNIKKLEGTPHKSTLDKIFKLTRKSMLETTKVPITLGVAIGRVAGNATFHIKNRMNEGKPADITDFLKMEEPEAKVKKTEKMEKSEKKGSLIGAYSVVALASPIIITAGALGLIGSSFYLAGKSMNEWHKENVKFNPPS